MGKYPYKTTIKDENMLKIFHRLEKNRVSMITDKNLCRSIGWVIKPIRKDVRITRDYTYDNSSFIHLEPLVDLKIKKNNLFFNKRL